MWRADWLPHETASRYGGRVTTGRAHKAPLLEVLGIRKSFRRGPEEVHALDDVDLSLSVGEVVGLIGPSGSGKTTLLNVLYGWEDPAAGAVRWVEGDSEARAERRPWRDVAIVPQDLGLLEELSARENAELPVRLAGLSGEQYQARVDRLLRAFGLDTYADRRLGEISLGEQQRVALARALILVPRLILADEPTGHQDAKWALAVFRAFRWISGRGTTCLVATHSREFLKTVDRVITIRDGHLRHEERTRGDEAKP